MADQESLTRGLVDAVLAWPVTAEDAAAVRRLLLDHIAAAVWGASSPVAEIMFRHVSHDLARGGATLPVIGRGLRLSAVEAAMANAVAAAAGEIDDTYSAGSVHPGSVIFPAAMAACALAGADDSSFVRSVIVGYEVMCRAAVALNPLAHRARHFHPTATTGHFGAAAAASAALGIDAGQMVAALGLAGTVAGGNMQFLVDRAPTKQVHPAFAVQRGVQAALLAARGFRGVADPIGGERAFLASQSEAPEPHKLLAGLGGQPRAVHLTGIKPYPSCRNTHSPVDAIFRAIGGQSLPAAEISEVTIGLTANGMITVWDPPERRRRPKTLLEAQFSMPFVAAVALLDGELGLAQFEPGRFAEPRVTALMDRVTCVNDPELDKRYPASWPAWAEVVTADGNTLRGEVEHPKGDPERPMTSADLERKAREMTRGLYGDDKFKQVVAVVRALPGRGGLTRLMELI